MTDNAFETNEKSKYMTKNAFETNEKSHIVM